MKKFESYHKKLLAIKDELETELDKREEIFEYRSEKWCESEKGEEYEDRTDTLRDAISELEGSMTLLEELF